MKAIVFGAGRVGAAIAYDLAREEGWKVTVADRSADALAAVVARAAVTTIEADLSDSREVTRLAGDFDLAIGALPSSFGFAALRAAIEAGRPYVDISFFEQDPFALDELAKGRGVTAVVDCGVAPGSDNLILGHLTTVLDDVERFVCAVGGLPVERAWPWEYKAPFAPADVIAEYTRPARYVAHGEVVTRPALSEPELMDFPGVGTLEAFNTDGLRTLLSTLPVPHMKEITLRYPGHAEKMRVLRQAGFFSPEPIEVAGAAVSPLALTSKLLFDAWRYGDEEEDLTVMRVVVEGRRGGVAERHTYDLLDRYDPATGLSSMARTTGFTCAAVARRVAAGDFARPGVSAPEHVGQAPGCYQRVMAELEERGVRFRRTVEILGSSAQP